MAEYATLIITSEFIELYGAREFSYADRQRFRRALSFDSDERHPSLRVHQLQGNQAGKWSASASDALRITFERLPDGRKRLLICSRHYQ